MPEKYTLQEFGALIKSKYPDYQNIDDVDLAQRVLAKYPEYRDRVSSEATIETQAPEEEYSLSGFGQNVLESGKRFAEETASGIAGLSPIGSDLQPRVPPTLKSAAGLAAGTAQKLIPGQQDQEQYFDAVAGQLAERYGGLENLKRTAYEDPVGFAADAASLLGGGGAALRAARLPKAAAAVSKAAQFADPIQLAKKGAAGVARPVINRMDPKAAYQSAMKPGGTAKKTLRKQQRALDAALEEDIPLSDKGLNKTRDLISEMQGEVNSIIEGLSKEGVTVDTGEVVKRLDELREQVKNTAMPETALQQIDAVRDEFLSFHGKKIPIQKAQQIKQGTYKQIQRSYGELSSNVVEAQKAIARGLKEKIAEAFPEIADLNAREAKLLDLEPFLEKALKRIENRDLISLRDAMALMGGTGVGFGAGEPLLGGLGGATALAFMKLTDSPQMKARMARAIYQAQKRKLGPKRAMSYGTILNRLNSYLGEVQEELGIPTEEGDE